MSKNTTKIWIRIFIPIRKTFTNVHKHRNPKNTKHLRLFFGSGTKLLFTFLSLRFFDMRRERERDTHNFFLSWFFHLTPPREAPRRKLLVWPRRGPENQLPSSSVESQLTGFFFKSQNPQPIASGHDVIHVLFPGPISYLEFLLWHLWLSHPPHARVNTCTQCVLLTNPCTKLKGSQPN